MGFIRALIVLHQVFGKRRLRDRTHLLLRFLTAPMLRVLAAVPRGASLLDIGAGHGLFAALAQARGAARIVAVEPDARKVRPLTGIDFVIAYDDAVAGTYDAISIIDVLYKIPTCEWDAMLLRCRARLAANGILIIKEQDPTSRFKNGWNRAQERVASALGLTLGDSFSYESSADFTARLQRLGFANIESRRIDAGYPHPHILYVASVKPSPAS